MQIPNCRQQVAGVHEISGMHRQGIESSASGRDYARRIGFIFKVIDLRLGVRHQQFQPIPRQAYLMLELLFCFARLIESGIGALECSSILFQFLRGRGILRRKLVQRFLLPLDQVAFHLCGLQICG